MSTPGGPWIVGEGFPDVVAQIFEAGTTIINEDGLFVYNAVPAKGTLILAIAGAAGTDQFGNNFAQGLNIGVWDPVTGDQDQHFGVDDNGNLYLADHAGATRIYMDPAAQILNFYTPGTASLLMSLAGTAGTDPFTGQTYPQGLAVYGANGQIINVEINGSVLSVNLMSGGAAEDNPANIQAFLAALGAGVTRIDGRMFGPTVTGFTDQAWIGLQSSASDGSSFAGGNLYYIDRGGTNHPLLEWGEGVLIAPGLADNNPMTVGELILSKTGDQTINTFGFQALTGLVCNMAANSKYYIEGVLFGENLTAAVNDLWACVFPAGSTATLWGWFAPNAASTPIVTTSTAGGTFTSPAYPVGTIYQFHFGGTCTTAGASGTFSVQGSESAAGDTWKTFDGWSVKVRRVSGG